jgi:hypothetical protein
MNQQQRAVVQQALDALIYASSYCDTYPEIESLRQLLEQPEPVQEPQAFLHWYDNAHWGNEDFKEGCHRSWNAAIKYTTPPAQPADHGDELTIAYLDGVHTGKQIAKREWVGLTEEQTKLLWHKARLCMGSNRQTVFKNLIEAHHGITAAPEKGTP